MLLIKSITKSKSFTNQESYQNRKVVVENDQLAYDDDLVNRVNVNVTLFFNLEGLQLYL